VENGTENSNKTKGKGAGIPAPSFWEFLI